MKAPSLRRSADAEAFSEPAKSIKFCGMPVVIIQRQARDQIHTNEDTRTAVAPVLVPGRYRFRRDNAGLDGFRSRLSIII